MFIRVKYGDKRDALFNIFCKTNLLIESIKQRCNIHDSIEIDLIDLHGLCKRIQENRLPYAHAVLKHREILILARVERNELGKIIGYEPLLKDFELITEEFKEKIVMRNFDEASQMQFLKNSNVFNKPPRGSLLKSGNNTHRNTTNISKTLYNLIH